MKTRFELFITLGFIYLAEKARAHTAAEHTDDESKQQPVVAGNRRCCLHGNRPEHRGSSLYLCEPLRVGRGT